MAGFIEDRFKLFGDEVVSFAPLVIDQFLGGALKRSIVAPLMTAEQRLHQVTACHAMNILAQCATAHAEGELLGISGACCGYGLLDPLIGRLLAC